MDLASILESYRDEIVREWSHRLKTEVSQNYRLRPIDELIETTSEAAEANFAVIVEGDFSKIDRFIERITKMRLESGFSLSEVQKAFELYRTIVVPIFLKELEGDELLLALESLNRCLSYTIHRFSDYFQSLHERAIKEYAENLEKEVEERTRELAESEAKYRILVEEVTDGFFVLQKGRVVFANRAFSSMHGYSPDEVVGRPYTDFVAPESISEVKRFYQRRFRDGDLFVYMRLHKDGRSLPTESKVKVIHYQGKRSTAGICRDITERVEMERQIRESERLAHIGKLMASLAHEIRNPLSSLKMNVQILLKNLVLEGNDRRRMEIVSKEISRLESILEEMLDLAKPVPLKLRPVSLNDVVDASLSVLDVRFREKSIRVERKLSKKMPKILLDPDKLEQALINVLLNSFEVLPDGGHIQVVTRHLKSEDSVEVIIKDNGPGVSEEDIPFIFDPFFSKKKKGTGLGLANVKKVVEAHGGTVRAFSCRPEGLAVAMKFPVRR